MKEREKKRLGKGINAIIPRAQSTTSKDKARSSHASQQLPKEKLQESLREAEKQPRVTVWSPFAKAILVYLRKTTPEFSISEASRKILESGVKSEYPKIASLVSRKLK